ncbi:MAG: hypothetical protein E7486_04760, partial [Ruminococcaceae bacterium]|nr:hypothetical protein [Oscillospiraceae bacterium]
DGFIYTVSFENSAGGTDMQNAIRCLNPSGSNIAKNDQPFGDLDTYYSKEAGGMVTSTFRDLCVSEDEYLYALDDTSGKIFIYDSTYTLLFVFGGSGDQKGTFRNPAAIDLMGNQIVVLDRGKNSITTFEPTDFFQTVHSANQLFHAGMYQEALEPWNQVLRECADYPAACRGIGRALFNSGDYAEAMNYFEKANDKASYSDAFKYYRLELLGDQFILWLCLIAGGVILLVVAVKWLFPLVKPKLAGAVGKLPSQARRKLQAPFNCLFHPFTGFEEMREQDLASWPVSLGILAVYILVSLIQMEGTGFIFREGQGDVTDLGQTVMMICGIYALWAVSSMALRTFLGGRARLRDVCGATSAMLIPLCLTTLANTLISQFIIADEGSLLSGISIVGLIWAAGMLIGGIRGINEYELGRTVGAILLTALFCCLILFLLILFLSSFQQVYSLFGTIFSEFKYRFL